MKRVFASIVVLMLFATALTGCNTAGDNQQLSALQAENEALKAQLAALEQGNDLVGAALNVMTLLSNQDFVALASRVHPSKGVRFSAYAYVDIENDLVFAAEAFSGLLADPTVYTWGAFDGTGFPIELSFADYYARFIYDQDFLNPSVLGINHVISFGNTIVNIDSAYEGASFVEFHFTGFDPQYEGMDWRSLFLIFEQVNEQWHLVGIAHSEWTI